MTQLYIQNSMLVNYLHTGVAPTPASAAPPSPDDKSAGTSRALDPRPCGAGWQPGGGRAACGGPRGYPGNPPEAPVSGVPSGPRAACQAAPQNPRGAQRNLR